MPFGVKQIPAKVPRYGLEVFAASVLLQRAGTLQKAGKEDGHSQMSLGFS